MSHAIKIWSNGAHMNVREGQIMFVARNNGRTDSASDVWSKHTTEASLQHLNMLCEQGWRAARYPLVCPVASFVARLRPTHIPPFLNQKSITK